MEKVGPWLRQAREARGNTLEEAEKATRIRAQLLELLEAGDFAAFPGSDVQVRGFLRIYARYLDLSGEEALKRYGTQVDRPEPLAVEALPEAAQAEAGGPIDDLTSIRFRPRDIPMSSSLPRWMSVETVLIVGIVLTVLLAMLAVASYLMNRPDGEPALPSSWVTGSTRIASAAAGIPSLVDSVPFSSVDEDEKAAVASEAVDEVVVLVKHGWRVVLEWMSPRSRTGTAAGETASIPERGDGAPVDETASRQAEAVTSGRQEARTRAWIPSGRSALL